ncbi:cation:proton antiporter [Nocardia carnea]|uniref:cation:proton antiporter n=1 Tax=Nocardia carnea TaxID=37328 RepID=UPI002454A22F|nr:cation:proton antiporter [Nocardia carnea]
MAILLLDLVLIIGLARGLGALVQRFGQPAVIGEIAAGILAGPTILGANLSSTIFPDYVTPPLTVLANIGVIVFMFLAGIEVDHRQIGGRSGTIVAIALSCFAASFVLGCAVAMWPLARHQPGNRFVFVLFVGCALAVTAFPVLARILQDRGLFSTPLGQLSMGSAAFVDVQAWCALAVVFALARPEFDAHRRLLLLLPLIVVLWWGVRPVLARISSSGGRETVTITLGISGAMVTAAATEWMGLHLIFGAFLFGIIFPRSQRPVVEPGARVVSTIFLPAFFVCAGLQANLSGLDRAAWGEAIVILVAAVTGKLGGTYAAARLCHIDNRTSAALAALMNTRGLTELVVLNAGLAIGVISSQVYSILVLMALVTTAMTAPLLTAFGVERSELSGGNPTRAIPVLGYLSRIPRYKIPGR